MRKKKGKKKQAPSATTGEAAAAAAAASVARRGGLVLNPALLPPFSPIKDVVYCNNGPMTTLMWAFCANVPPSLRFALLNDGSNASLATNFSPEVQWNYSMFHLAHHYGSSLNFKKFVVENEEETKSILLEITSLRACPDTQGEMRELSRDAFCDPYDKDKSLGPVPLFFVRYLYTASGVKALRPKSPRDPVGKFLSGAVMKISAASAAELEFGYKTLQRGQRFLSSSPSSSNSTSGGGKFQESVIFPTAIKEAKAPKVPYVCASCESTLPTDAPLKCCSRCKVTYYCSRDCQCAHWKAGHKLVCRKATGVAGGDDDAVDGDDSKAQRPSIVFDVTNNPRTADGMCVLSMSSKTGHMTVQSDTDLSDELKKDKSAVGRRLRQVPEARNIRGDKEFIVKLQPPAGSMVGYPSAPWMCYDGPVRSFQAYIPADTTGLHAVYDLLVRDGIEGFNPMVGVKGYKGFFLARWEGSSVRVFYDRLVPAQSW